MLDFLPHRRSIVERYMFWKALDQNGRLAHPLFFLALVLSVFTMRAGAAKEWPAVAAGRPSVPPEVGPYRYGFGIYHFSVKEMDHFSFRTRAAAEAAGMHAYFKVTRCHVHVTQYGNWNWDNKWDVGKPTYLDTAMRAYAKDDLAASDYSIHCRIYLPIYSGLIIGRVRKVTCPSGYRPNEQTHLCDPPPKGTIEPGKNQNNCAAGRHGGDCIQFASGAVLAQESDYHGKGVLHLRRYYSSAGFTFDSSQMGDHWRHNFSYRLSAATVGEQHFATLYRPDGNHYYFQQKQGGTWQNEGDVPLRLTSRLDENGKIVAWKVRNLHGPDEHYNAQGQLTTLTWPGAQKLSFSYKGHQLVRVKDETGRSLKLKYTKMQGQRWQLTRVTTPDGSTVTYHYAAGGHKDARISKVVYTGVLSGQPVRSSRSYSYDGSDLTGVTDERGRRIRTWVYNGNHQAIMRVYGDDNAIAGKTELVYHHDGTTSLSNWIDRNQSLTRKLSFKVIKGVPHISSSQKSIQLPDTAALPATVKYDIHGYPVHTKDFSGHITTTAYDTYYDGYGVLLSKVEADGTDDMRFTDISWDKRLFKPLMQETSDAFDVLVTVKGWAYNSRGQVTARCQIDPKQASDYTCRAEGRVPRGVRRWTYTYCNVLDHTQCPLVGLLRSVTGPRSDLTQTTHYRYYLGTDESGCGMPGGGCHQAGDLYQVTDALGHTRSNLAYDKNGHLLRQRDANGVITDFAYHPRGWLISRIVRARADGLPSAKDVITKMDYDGAGDLIKHTDPDGVSLSYIYDGARRLTDVRDGLGNQVHVNLNALGQSTGEEYFDPQGHLQQALSRHYNPQGELTGINDGFDRTIFNASARGSFNADGSLLRSLDALGNAQQRSYDTLGRPVQIVQDANGVMRALSQFSYDTLNHITALTDPDGLQTIYHYDGLGNPTSAWSHNSGKTTRRFDAAGNMLSSTDARGVTATYHYDALNRLTSIRYPDDRLQNVSYHYDEANGLTGCRAHSFPVGHVTRMVENAVTTVYCYDAHGNITLKRQMQAKTTDTMAYTWTRGHRLASVRYPDGIKVIYQRNGGGQIAGITMKTVSGDDVTLVKDISYQAFGPVNHYILGNAQIITRRFDANGRLSDLISPVWHVHVERDAMGDVTKVHSNFGTQSYSYDALYRLVKVKSSTGKVLQAYTYSPGGDRLSKTGSGQAIGLYRYAVNSHRLIATGNLERSLDANGNTTGLIRSGLSYQFGYNARNRLAWVSQGGAVLARYTYNALGERVKKVTDRTMQRFSYGPHGQLLSRNSMHTSRDIVWMGSIPVAVLDTKSGNTRISYIIADHLGTPRVLTDAKGNIIWKLPYQAGPFGEGAAQSINGHTVLNLRRPGQYYDSETGLVYNLNRYYEPSTGRYIQSAPAGLASGLNPYSYADNHPLRADDSTGPHTSQYRKSMNLPVSNAPGPKGALHKILRTLETFQHLPKKGQARLGKAVTTVYCHDVWGNITPSKVKHRGTHRRHQLPRDGRH